MPSFSSLPPELLTEITKYHPELLIDVDARIQGLPPNEFAGIDTLRALSHTCRSLRQVTLPELWKRVHTITDARKPERSGWQRDDRWFRPHSKMLRRRMIGIEKTPYVAPSVRSLTISLIGCNMYTWEPVAHFVRVLGLLPNLRSLTVLNVLTDIVDLLDSTFKGRTFPTIETLAIPPIMAALLPYFPNVHTLIPCGNLNATVKEILLSKSREVYEHVHTIHNLPVTREFIQSVQEKIPQLQCISIWQSLSQAELSLLTSLTFGSLTTLIIRVRDDTSQNLYTYYSHAPPPPSVDEVITAAEGMLRRSNGKGRKVLRVQRRGIQGWVREENVFVVE
ncbi:hypothetical protein FB45DRAFT_1091204 [Roridomyces roridus]|uniref:F-box domain-containing protein n=1 Tax=Roridomyces roridus TaxID=1738132 RepID=A0AAD7FII0_9AGAR|nr:hypothetical protein FB45DRAFT_1091204 [Roridomyces roridus]